MIAQPSGAFTLRRNAHRIPGKGRRYLKRRIKAQTRSSKNIVIRPSLLAQSPRCFLFIVLTTLMFYANEWFQWSVRRVFLGSVLGYDLGLTLSLFAIPALIVFVQIVWIQQNRRYILCTDYILEIEGLLSYTLRTVRLRYLHIRGLEVVQTLPQRTLNVGDLRVGGEASPEDTDIVMLGIYNPNRYKEIIKERVTRKLKELSHVSVMRQATG